MLDALLTSEQRGLADGRYWFAGALVAVHVQAAHSYGRVGVWEFLESRGSRLPLHTHHREDERVVLLDGEVTFWVGDRAHDLERDTRSPSREASRMRIASHRARREY